MIVSGRICEFVVLLLACGLAVFVLLRAKKLKFPSLRMPAAIASINDVIARAVELGRPVLADAGWANITETDSGLQGLAGITVIGYVAELAARFKADLITLTPEGAYIGLMQETIQAAYNKEGRPELKPNVVFVPGTGGFSYPINVIGYLERERAGAWISVGNIMTSGILITESAYRVGAVSIMGTTRIEALSYIVPSVDYSLIGEEVLAAGALLSRDPRQIGSIVVSDIVKLGVIGAIIVGVVFGLTNSPWFVNLLRS